ncbi:MAG: metal ABC transporter permease [Selenomonadaceae bacterium]|nr:metal ABC transporter permease [Selenomonadaceae bacterium]
MVMILFEYEFMRNALVAVLLVTPLFGLLSTMVVSNRMAFFSDSLGHGAFTGIAIGALIGVGSEIFGLLAFSIIFALLITYIKNKSHAGADTVIGVFSSTAIALGLMLMSAGGQFNKFSRFLIGDLLSISRDDLFSLTAVFAVVVISWAILFNRLLILSVNQTLARSRGIKTRQVESIFAVLLALVVALSIQWVGILIINALLVLPAAAARNVTNSVKSYHVLSVLIALTSGLVGLFLAYEINSAAGATIVVCAAFVYFVTLILKPQFVK